MTTMTKMTNEVLEPCALLHFTPFEFLSVFAFCNTTRGNILTGCLGFSALTVIRYAAAFTSIEFWLLCSRAMSDPD
jgi:hypothetical protein